MLLLQLYIVYGSGLSAIRMDWRKATTKKSVHGFDHAKIAHCWLTWVPLGYLAEHAPLGGGADSAPPPPNSRTRGLSEVGEATNESFRRVLFRQCKKKS